MNKVTQIALNWGFVLVVVFLGHAVFGDKGDIKETVNKEITKRKFARKVAQIEQTIYLRSLPVFVLLEKENRRFLDQLLRSEKFVQVINDRRNDILFGDIQGWKVALKKKFKNSKLLREEGLLFRIEDGETGKVPVYQGYVYKKEKDESEEIEILNHFELFLRLYYPSVDEIKKAIIDSIEAWHGQRIKKREETE